MGLTIKNLYLDNELDCDSELMIEVTSNMDQVTPFFIDKDDAKKIIEHIQKAFNLGESK